MPKGIYTRTEKHRAISRKNMLKAQSVSANHPNTLAAVALNAQKAWRASLVSPNRRKTYESEGFKRARRDPKNVAAWIKAGHDSSARKLHASKQALKNRVSPSKIQIEFSDVLKKFIPDLRCDDYTIRAGCHFHCPDIVNVKTRKIVEVDGAYWHDAEKDRVRDARLKSVGWDVLRLPADRAILFDEAIVNSTILFLNETTRVGPNGQPAFNH